MISGKTEATFLICHLCRVSFENSEDGDRKNTFQSLVLLLTKVHSCGAWNGKIRLELNSV